MSEDERQGMPEGTPQQIGQLAERVLGKVKRMDPAYVPLFTGPYRGEFALDYIPTQRRPQPWRPRIGRSRGTIFFITDRPDFGQGYGPEGVHAWTMYQLVQIVDYSLENGCDCTECPERQAVIGEAMRRAKLGGNVLLLDCWPATYKAWRGLLDLPRCRPFGRA